MSRLLLVFGILIVLSLGCMGGGSEEATTTPPTTTAAPVTSAPTTSPPETAPPEIIVVPEWMNAELTDPVSLETLKISDLKGKPMLMVNLDTTLTSILKQQQAMKEIQSDSIVLISLNLEKNEDKRSLEGYKKKKGFDWYFVLPPPGMKDDLVDDFGLDVINPEKVPVVLICKDLSSRLLDQGIKSAETLESEIESGC